MADSDKLTIANMVITVILTVIGWVILIWATKRTIQAMLATAIPTATPTTKSEVAKLENTDAATTEEIPPLTGLRLLELVFASNILNNIIYFALTFASLPRYFSRFDLFQAFLNMATFGAAIVFIVTFETLVIPQIKAGDTAMTLAFEPLLRPKSLFRRRRY